MNKFVLGRRLGAVILMCWLLGVGPTMAQQAAAININDVFAGKASGQDAVQLSFLILNRDGTPQMERAAHFPFYTGEIFRLRVLASSSGVVQLSSVSPGGQITPFRPVRVQAGIAASYPENARSVLTFDGATGVEVLRISFVPDGLAVPVPTPIAQPLPIPASTVPPVQVAQRPVSPATPALPQPAAMPASPSQFFTGVEGKAYTYGKDIREIVLETPVATILTRPSGTGALEYEVRIQHRNY